MEGLDILQKMQNCGYLPQNKKEQNFIQNLQDKGFVKRDYKSGLYKLIEGTIVKDNIENVTLLNLPKINGLGLYLKANNFNPEHDYKIKNLNVQLCYLGNMKSIDWDNILKGHNLGENVVIQICGYGKTDKIECYQVKLPDDIKVLQYNENKKFAHFTVSMSKDAKEKDSAMVEFKPLRSASAITVLGVGTSQGVFYSLQELLNAKTELVIDKTEFYN